MTADTPSRTEIGKRAVAHIARWGGSQTNGPLLVAFAEAEIAHLAAKPADDGVREATIEESAKVVDAFIERCDNRGDAQTQGQIGAALGLARDIRALSTKANP
jgi:hypothetical protein